MLQTSSLKTSIFFETNFCDSDYTLRYSWLDKNQIKISLHWKSRPIAQQETFLYLSDLRKIVDTFEALAREASYSNPPDLDLNEILK